MINQERYHQWLKKTEVKDVKAFTELLQMNGQIEIIKEHFGDTLSFGTGGIRGIMGQGTNRMNSYVIGQVTQGLAESLISNHTKDIKVLIAYDSRINSKEFAIKAATVLVANDIKVYLFKEPRPTPECSFAVRYLSCHAGIMITASHNPKEYNGYKLYGDDGAQLNDKLAGQIVERIKSIDIFNDVKEDSLENATIQKKIEFIGSDIDNAYLQKIQKVGKNNKNEAKGLIIVYTPLHGAAYSIVSKALYQNGFIQLHVVEEQKEPDGDFPTVPSPNPEDVRALKLAIELAEKEFADIVLATDPDGDRVAVVARNQKGILTPLTGNQVGTLLVHYLIQARPKKELQGVIINTIVSSDLGRKIAVANGFHTMHTLTGFKFIAEKIREIEEGQKYAFVLGYEESMGYLADTFVRDKDAVMASVLIAEMAAHAKKNNSSLFEELEHLYRLYGYHLELTDNFTYPGIDGKEIMASIVAKVRNIEMLKEVFPSLWKVEDYLEGITLDIATNIKEALDFPKSDVVKVFLDEETWFVVRPSGTEPKLKAYYAVVGKTREIAQGKLDELREKVLAILK